MTATAMVIATSNKGDLTVQASHAFARRMHQIGASRLPDGSWHVPASRAKAFNNLISPPRPPANHEVPKAPRPEPAVPPPEIEDVTNWFVHLPKIEGLTISRPDGFRVGFRFLQNSPAALEAIKAVPGRVWNPNHGAWEVRVRDWQKMEQIRSALDAVQEALKVKYRRRRSEVEAVYSILDAPNLMTPVECDGQIVVFERAGRVFRIHEGHIRRAPRLAPRSGDYGSVLYGRSATPEEEALYHARARTAK